MLKFLEPTWPDCFNWQDPKPLKIGIRHDMLPTVLVAGYTGVVLSHLVCLGLEMAWNAARSHDVSI